MYFNIYDVATSLDKRYRPTYNLFRIYIAISTFLVWFFTAREIYFIWKVQKDTSDFSKISDVLVFEKEKF